MASRSYTGFALTPPLRTLCELVGSKRDTDKDLVRRNDWRFPLSTPPFRIVVARQVGGSNKTAIRVNPRSTILRGKVNH
jgi:hypothetical protein